MAIPIVLANDPDVFALPWRLPTVAGLIAVAIAGTLLFRAATGARSR